MKASCESCNWWREFPTQDEEGEHLKGSCVRCHPVPRTVMSAVNDEAVFDVAMHNVWPVTYAEDVCLYYYPASRGKTTCYHCRYCCIAASAVTMGDGKPLTAYMCEAEPGQVRRTTANGTCHYWLYGGAL